MTIAVRAYVQERRKALPFNSHVVAKLNPTKRYTYGFGSASILAALLNGVILLVATGGIALRAFGAALFFGPHIGATGPAALNHCFAWFRTAI